MLREMPDDARIAEQVAYIANSLDEIELVCAVGLFDQLELSIEILGLALHHRDLFLGQPTGTPLPPLNKLVLWSRRNE